MGKVASVNGALRYAVLDFALNPLPAVGAQMGVYRHGVKVGEVKITGPAYHSNTVGDLVAGEAQVGDDIRRNP